MRHAATAFYISTRRRGVLSRRLPVRANDRFYNSMCDGSGASGPERLFSHCTYGQPCTYNDVPFFVSDYPRRVYSPPPSSSARHCPGNVGIFRGRPFLSTFCLTHICLRLVRPRLFQGRSFTTEDKGNKSASPVP